MYPYCRRWIYDVEIFEANGEKQISTSYAHLLVLLQCAVACHRDAEVLLTDNDPSVGRLSAAGVLSSSLTWWLIGQRGRRARGMRLDDDVGPVQHEKDRDH